MKTSAAPISRQLNIENRAAPSPLWQIKLKAAATVTKDIVVEAVSLPFGLAKEFLSMSYGPTVSVIISPFWFLSLLSTEENRLSRFFDDDDEAPIKHIILSGVGLIVGAACVLHGKLWLAIMLAVYLIGPLALFGCASVATIIAANLLKRYHARLQQFSNKELR
jgi:hypothetical protein